MVLGRPAYKIETEISNGGVRELERIEHAARTCYRSEPSGSFEITKKFIAKLISSGHEAMLEHGGMTVKFTVDRGVSHELVRHRTASFAQESTRYCNYSAGRFGSNVEFIDLKGGIEWSNVIKNVPESRIVDILDEWTRAMEDAEKHYMAMIDLGATAQIARSVLPNSTKTTVIITANWREWRHIFSLRCAPDAHPQMREVMCPLLLEMKSKIPVLFDDIRGDGK